MEMKLDYIDGGKPFDWGRTSEDYAKFRDIYPPLFYEKIAEKGLCVKDQKVLDIGTGTGVLPRNMYKYGADWTGTDISADQIKYARKLADDAGMRIKFIAAAAEDIDFPAETFDIVTACQCFWYFDYKTVMPKLAKLLKTNGKVVVLQMNWLPYEDIIAGKSEELILKYNPGWTGAGETRHPVIISDVVTELFELTDHEEYEINVPFTRESWHGRMRACRGTAASMSAEVFEKWEAEHIKMLEENAPQEFNVLHYATAAILTKKG